MKIISQGKPSSPYFCIAYPMDGDGFEPGEEVKCIHPRTNKVTTGIYVDRFTWSWHAIPDSFCLLQFGMNAADYRRALCEAKPEFRDQEQIRILMILETK